MRRLEVTLKNIQGKEFELEMYMNINSIKTIEQEVKKIDKNLNYYKALPLIQKGELTIALIFVTCCLHRKGSKACVGLDWLDNNDIDFFQYSDELMTKLVECLEDNKPTVEPKEGK